MRARKPPYDEIKVFVWYATHNTSIYYMCFNNVYNWLQPVEVNQDERSNGTSKSLTNSYLQTDIAKTYQACYSNGVNNGFVSQEIKNRANGKKHHKAY